MLILALIIIPILPEAVLTGLWETTALDNKVIPCRLNALTIALSFGVPLAKLPSLSSA